MRFVLISPTKVVDMEKISIAEFSRAIPELSLSSEEKLIIWEGDTATHLTGAEARTLWDQITIETRVSEPSGMFDAVQKVVRSLDAIHPTDRSAAAHCSGCRKLFAVLVDLKATFKL